MGFDIFVSSFGFRASILKEFWLLREELAVAHSDDPIRHGRSLLAVGDEDDRLPLLVP